MAFVPFVATPPEEHLEVADTAFPRPPETVEEVLVGLEAQGIMTVVEAIPEAGVQITMTTPEAKPKKRGRKLRVVGAGK